MIDRSYLPFKSAREYVDRGMAKWTGFFISEHASSLAKDDFEYQTPEKMEREDLIILLNQTYINKLEVFIYTELRQKPFFGRIYDISDKLIYFNDRERILKINFTDIIKLVISEEDCNEK